MQIQTQHGISALCLCANDFIYLSHVCCGPAAITTDSTPLCQLHRKLQRQSWTRPSMCPLHDPCCSHCPVPTLLVVTLCVTLADQASYT